MLLNGKCETAGRMPFVTRDKPALQGKQRYKNGAETKAKRLAWGVTFTTAEVRN